MAAEYHPISVQEMEDFLRPQGFARYPHGQLKTWNGQLINEMVYVKFLTPNLAMRIYTGIDWRNQDSRGVGSDSIKVCLVYRQAENKVISVGGKERRVHRVKGWRNNLADRIGNWEAQLGPTCPVCGSPLMLKKPGRKSKAQFEPFYGCVEYNNTGCKGTMSVAYFEQAD